MAKLFNFLPFFFLNMFIIVTLFETISAQTAVSPAPAGPLNITKVLEKAGQFTTFIKLLKATQVSDRINSQLNNSNQGLTIFAPTDNAFSSLKSGTLNSISTQNQLQLLQFHILPTLYTISQFQTASNPLHTQAGNSDDGEYPLNVTTSGNQVNVTTGVIDTTVSNTIYSDSQLAVYQVDQVLLPMALLDKVRLRHQLRHLHRLSRRKVFGLLMLRKGLRIVRLMIRVQLTMQLMVLHCLLPMLFCLVCGCKSVLGWCIFMLSFILFYFLKQV
jgi:uncharacterized surface protein with fasciclin (FAS1) repeats